MKQVKLAGEILDQMKPSFKAGEYNAGLQTLVSGVRDALAVAVQPVPQQPVTTAPPVNEPSTAVTVIGVIVALGLIALAFFVVYKIIMAIFAPRRNVIRHNTPVNSNAGYYNNGYYNNGYNNPPGGSGLDNFVAGAATGYAARTIADDYYNNPPSGNYDAPPANDTANNDNQPANWGNWGSSDGGASSNDSSSSYDSGSSSSSNDDGGFSGSDSSGSDGGGSSDW